ncbi:MAG: hypothetical protein M3112_01835 [Actinomycetia bacterium]|nr:hypothetical protein [Actinomycetes bacterium]
MSDNIQITGGAGPETTAAIAAVVASIENEERLAAAVRPKPIHQSQWIRTGQSTKHVAPREPRARETDTSLLRDAHSIEAK